MEWLTQRFELSRGGEGQNLRPMEGLRGFAVFLVFLVHYVALVKPWIAGESATLTLTTCNPKYSARTRLVVRGLLDSVLAKGSGVVPSALGGR